MDELENSKPRVGKNYEKPGSYMLSPQLSNHVADPAESIRLKVLIRGYGQIQNCKVAFSYPEDLLDYDLSYVFKDLGLDGRNFVYGVNKQRLQKSGFSIDLQTGGHYIRSWGNSPRTYFFDVNDNPTPTVATEIELTRAPLELELVTKRNAKAGLYTIYVSMVYFNGVEWKSDRLEVLLTVSSLFQRNEVFFTRVAISLAVVSTFLAYASSILGFLDTMLNYYKELFR